MQKRLLHPGLFLTAALLALAVLAPSTAYAAAQTDLLTNVATIARKTTKTFAELTQPGVLRGNQCIPAPIGTRPGPPPVQTTTYDAATDVPVLTSEGRLVICPIAIANTLPRTQADANNAAVEFIIWIVNSIIVIVGNVGIIFLGLASHFLGFFLSENRFTTHPLVASGWPFLQGIANLGFVLGLLFIAGATALQLETYAWRKMLPKLLIAALLINFSLVIGAIIIDASRVIMAIEVRLMSKRNTNITQLGEGLLMSSPVLKGVYDAAGGGSLVSPGNHSWQTTLRLLQAASLIWVFTVGLLAVAVGVFARWIALVLLLIFSPLAYLSYALPNAEGLGKKWWKEFLKWTFYGPILLFLILIISNIGDDLPTGSLWQVFTNTIIMGVLLYAAAKSSTSFAGTGGAAVMGFASKMGKKGAYAAYVGSGGQRVARNARDFGSEVLKPLRKGLKIGEYDQYDKDGKLKAGKTSFGKELGGFVKRGGAGTAAVLGGVAGLAAGGPLGAVGGAHLGMALGKGGAKLTGTSGAATGAVAGGVAGSLIAGPGLGTAIGAALGATFGGLVGRSSTLLDPDDAAEASATRTLVAGAGVGASLNNPLLNASRLQKGHVLEALGNNAPTRDANIDIILGNGSASQAKAIAQNKDYLRGKEVDRIAEIEAAIRSNITRTVGGVTTGNLSAGEAEKAIEQLYKTLDEIKKE